MSGAGGGGAPSGGVATGGRGGSAAGASSGGGGTSGQAAGGWPVGGSGGETEAAAGAGGNESAELECSEAVGGKLVAELYVAGFETLMGDAHWQLRWKNFAEVQEWANPDSDFWKAPLESACTGGSSAPERVMFMVFSWKLKTQADWTKNIEQAIDNFKAKYPSLRRLDLMTQIVAPENEQCPTPPATGETITVSAELEAAMTEAAASHPGLVFVAPRFEARTCADLQGGGPHLNASGNSAAAQKVADYLLEN